MDEVNDPDLYNAIAMPFGYPTQDNHQSIEENRFQYFNYKPTPLSFEQAEKQQNTPIFNQTLKKLESKE